MAMNTNTCHFWLPNANTFTPWEKSIWAHQGNVHSAHEGLCSPFPCNGCQWHLSKSSGECSFICVLIYEGPKNCMSLVARHYYCYSQGGGGAGSQDAMKPVPFGLPLLWHFPKGHCFFIHFLYKNSARMALK